MRIMYLAADANTLEIVGSVKQQKTIQVVHRFLSQTDCYFHCFIVTLKLKEQYKQEKLKQLHILFSMPFSYDWYTFNSKLVSEFKIC